MRKLLIFLALSTAVVFALIHYKTNLAAADVKLDEATKDETLDSAEQDVGQSHPQPYPDFGFAPGYDDYRGSVFHLSQRYPQQQPPDSEIPEVAKGDFSKVTDAARWEGWMKKVKDYCFEGNIDLGAIDVEGDWQVYKSDKWFNMPWQHWGPNGREAIHGLTKEAQVHSNQLAADQKNSGQTYAVAFYNRFGGYGIGRVWTGETKDKNGRDLPPKRIKDFRFPVGTVICKLLFVDVPVSEVPSLNPPVQWQAFITKSYTSTERAITKVSLIQMDIMGAHENAPLQWVFGTFQYNGASKKADPKNPWDRLVPVGIQWKNDPEVTVENPVEPAKTAVGDATHINPRLHGTIVNSDSSELPPTHLGWGGRLNGPVDNGTSSCISCHMTAQMPQQIPLFPGMVKPQPKQNSKEWMLWFRDLKPGDKFVTSDEFPELGKDLYTADFSLQMAEAVQNWYHWRNEAINQKASVFERKRSVHERAGIKQKFINPGTDEITPTRDAGQ